MGVYRWRDSQITQNAADNSISTGCPSLLGCGPSTVASMMELTTNVCRVRRDRRGFDLGVVWDGV